MALTNRTWDRDIILMIPLSIQGIRLHQKSATFSPLECDLDVYFDCRYSFITIFAIVVIGIERNDSNNVVTKSDWVMEV